MICVNTKTSPFPSSHWHYHTYWIYDPVRVDPQKYPKIKGEKKGNTYAKHPVCHLNIAIPYVVLKTATDSPASGNTRLHPRAAHPLCRMLTVALPCMTLAGKAYKVRGEQIPSKAKERSRNKSKRWQLGREGEERSRAETELTGNCKHKTSLAKSLAIPSGSHLVDARQCSPIHLHVTKLTLF